MKRSAAQRCEFAGHENTKNGALVPCPAPGVVVIRLRGLEILQIGKPIVCERHMRLLVSKEVRAEGRDWQIDHYLRDLRTKEP